ncbi:hypothetical protein VSH64_21590 [Amycolatopsis rhabdoformis]|uniref:Lipoprotein n=1 Tax=Amycolatopsis rhabdoformis TaxID=1448059 RepID=A0ABZ1ILJ6_9PSEU|nr:hypothetical protein [Amycolatopsis rhabdoformis]WSE34641.1 hypothetical protein VSH64_21590 [Amycolatopsis rhabdoformis]
MRGMRVVVAGAVLVGGVACTAGQPAPTTSPAPSTSWHPDTCLDLEAFNEALGPDFDQDLRDLATKGDTPDTRSAIASSVEVLTRGTDFGMAEEFAVDMRLIVAAAREAKDRLAAGLPTRSAISPLTTPRAESARSLLIALEPKC